MGIFCSPTPCSTYRMVSSVVEVLYCLFIVCVYLKRQVEWLPNCRLRARNSDGKSTDTYQYFSLVLISISITTIEYFSHNFSSFSKNWRKNSTKFPSKCLKICTKVLHIFPQISLKFQRNVFKISS